MRERRQPPKQRSSRTPDHLHPPPPPPVCLSSTSPSIVAQLRRYGLAGVLSYGALNCVWYTFAFWAAASVAGPAKAGLGLKGALAKGAEVLAYTWVGSQATKVGKGG